MPNNSDLCASIHALASKMGAVCENQQSDIDDLKGIKSTLTSAIAELARATDRVTKIEAWATAQGYDPSDYESNGE